jgi:hypothetical protein
MQIINNVTALPLTEYDDYDWCLFDDYDVVADVPITQIAPYLYSAYGPSTKVIQTVRNIKDWAER